jgi:hypothetical protein
LPIASRKKFFKTKYRNLRFEKNTTMNKRCFLLSLLAFAVIFNCVAQCRTYMIGIKGDTLNCTDFQNRKQGKWTVHVENVRGEPGYEEEGIYKNDKKEGLWRVYTLMGDLQAIENYKWGGKNGISQYFTLQCLLREESWKVIDPDNPFDTVKVYDLNNPDKFTLKIVKVEGTSEKYGKWKYYNPSTGAIVKTEEYVLGQLIDPLKSPYAKPAQDSMLAQKTIKESSGTTKTKPPEVLEYEKKNQKKKIKVREGQTGLP